MVVAARVSERRVVGGPVRVRVLRYRIPHIHAT
jgi:hypothetical protein